jgi:nucleoside-diphosphate-sugar epimerase
VEVPFLILGAGFTGARVALRLAARGLRVIATSGRPETCAEWANLAPGARVLYSIPPAPGEADRLQLLAGRAARVVYLSSTAVYGATCEINEDTPPAPRTPREKARLASEAAVQSGPWETMVLRPAAIYGPGRGVHESMRRGSFRLLGDGSNYVSRIHVEDLAALAEAALLSRHTGTWPVADEEPCESREIAAFCAALLGLPLPPQASAAELTETRRANRRVAGSAVFRLLGVTLRYPSYRTGIPACLAAEDNLKKT